MITLSSRVCGEWRQGSGEPAVLVNPATEEEMARTSTEDLDFAAAVRHAREVGGPALRELTFAGRAALLKAMSKSLHACREELLDLAVKNGGNTRGDAKFDVDGATGTLAAYASIGKEVGERHVLLDGDGMQLSRTPRYWGQHLLVPREGVAVLVNAFNFPAWGFAEKAACALLAGMPVIVKPATSTALTTFRMVEILVDDGVLPEGALSLIAGSAGSLLDHLREQDVLAFTGSADTAKRLLTHENIVRHSVSVNVEADSLNASVLGPDVEPGSDTWHLFRKDVVKEMTQKAGQKCTAVRRILVPESRLADVEEELVAALSAVKVGNPGRSEVRMGPLSTKRQIEDGRAGVERLAGAAKVLTGGAGPVEAIGVDGGKGYFLAPTLLRVEDPAAGDVVHELEVFGPVATILPYDGTAAAAAELVRRGSGCLVSSAFGDDRAWLRDVVLGLGAWNGRLYLGSRKVADSAPGSGAALPLLKHGGPGRAGGGLELGGLRGLELYQQRVAVQGDRGILLKMFD